MSSPKALAGSVEWRWWHHFAVHPKKVVGTWVWGPMFCTPPACARLIDIEFRTPEPAGLYVWSFKINERELLDVPGACQEVRVDDFKAFAAKHWLPSEFICPPGRVAFALVNDSPDRVHHVLVRWRFAGLPTERPLRLLQGGRR